MPQVAVCARPHTLHLLPTLGSDSAVCTQFIAGFCSSRQQS